MELIAGIMLDVFFFARFTYIKTQFYKTKGVANGNDRRYISEFIYGYRGHNYVCSVKNNIFSRYHLRDRKSTRLNSSHTLASRMPSSA